MISNPASKRHWAALFVSGLIDPAQGELTVYEITFYFMTLGWIICVSVFVG